MTDKAEIYIAIWCAVYERTGRNLEANDVAAAAVRRFVLDATRVTA